jgi:hypothetical protein
MRFRFNEKKAAQAAAHLLKMNGGAMNYMTLIKILFLGDRESLVRVGQPITGSAMVSMRNGPVLMDVFELISDGGDGPWFEYISPPSGYDVKLVVPEPELDELSNYELRVLETLRQRFAHMGASRAGRKELVDWLHDHIQEWKDPRPHGLLGIEFVEVLRSHDLSEERIQHVRENAELKWAIGALKQ